ncbi:MAG: 16S rRNA (adenine(1518)-N(6)/adenine(1519)-N(6))-dimethyltransferase RsmA [Gemmatimonadota bacterium]
MGFRKKSLGQHFLFDRKILGRIAAAVPADKGETILEIGPGQGTLTRELAARDFRLVAIEKDRDLVPRLRSEFPEITVIEGDALEVDWHAAVGTDHFSIVGNIPYNITSPLIDKALTPPRPRVIVFLVQKEVAERVAARPGGAEYGALTVGVQAVARVERLFTVSAGAFSPPPNVDSAVLRMTPLETSLIADEQVPDFRKLVVGLFSFRRKQIGRAVRELTDAGKDQVSRWLALAGIAESRRPQELSPGDFAKLHAIIRLDGASFPPVHERDG